MAVTEEELLELVDKALMEVVYFCVDKGISREVIRSPPPACTTAEAIQKIARHFQLNIKLHAPQFPPKIEDIITKFSSAQYALRTTNQKLFDLTSNLPKKDKKLIDCLAKREVEQIFRAFDLFGEYVKFIVVGDTSSGKSTFINMLLGEKILPMTPQPSNTIITEITYGETPELLTYDLCDELVSTTNLVDPNRSKADIIHTTLKFDDHASKSIFSRAVIKLPNPLLQSGLQLIDTPGVSESNNQHNIDTIKAIEKFTPHCIGLLVVLNSSIGGISSQLASLIQCLANPMPLCQKDEATSSSKYRQPFPHTGAFFICNKWNEVLRQSNDAVAKTQEVIHGTIKDVWKQIILVEQVAHIDAREAMESIAAGTFEPRHYRDFISQFVAFFDKALATRLKAGISLAQQYHWAIRHLIIARRRMRALDYELLKQQISAISTQASTAIKSFSQKISAKMMEAGCIIQMECETNIDTIVTSVNGPDAPLNITVPVLHQNLQAGLITALQKFLSLHKNVFDNLATEVSTCETDCGITEVSSAIARLQISLFGSPLPVHTDTIPFIEYIFYGIITPLLLLSLPILAICCAFYFPISKTKRDIERLQEEQAYNKDRKGYVQKYCTKTLRKWLKAIPKQWKVPYELPDDVAMPECAVAAIESHCKLAILSTAKCNKISSDITTLERMISENPKAPQFVQINYTNHIQQLLQLDGELALINLRYADSSFNIPSAELPRGDSIGAGAFGSVYASEWNGKPVALKFVKDGTALSPIIADFMREAQTLKNLSHERILKCFGWSWKDQQAGGPSFCIVLEKCKQSLAMKLNQPCPTYPTARLRYALEIAEGMTYLHEKSLMHRDLKLENIMLSETDTVKIGDLGLTKNTQEISMTNCGTKGYMAPEIPKGYYSLPVDVYSYGLVLWELYYWKRVNTVAQNLVYEPRPSPRLYDIIQECLDQDERRRPKFSEIVQRLRNYISEHNEQTDQMLESFEERADSQS